MQRKRYRRIFTFAIMGIALAVVAALLLVSQLETRQEYRAIKNGEMVRATLYTKDIEEGSKGYFPYTFAWNGAVFAAYTTLSYYESQLSTHDFYVYVALEDGEKGAEVVLSGFDDIEINGIKYHSALSREVKYFEIYPREPSTTTSVVMFVLSGAMLSVALYYYVLMLRARDLEQRGTLTYGVFMEAFAPKAGSNRYFAVCYKYKDEDDNWVEATSPFIYAAVDCEKLLALETFRVKYKGKRSVIAEDVRSLRL